MKKLLYIDPVEYYSAIKRNKLLIYVTTWINVKQKSPNPKVFILHESIYMKF